MKGLGTGGEGEGVDSEEIEGSEEDHGFGEAEGEKDDRGLGQVGVGELGSEGWGVRVVGGWDPFEVVRSRGGGEVEALEIID